APAYPHTASRLPAAVPVLSSASSSPAPIIITYYIKKGRDSRPFLTDWRGSFSPAFFSFPSGFVQNQNSD
ncbi:MAG: hypothetical protein MR748_03895, partial [Clostridiales bacterium]|nr:hypothetical protein [Clostridiales bacterium]